MTIKTGNFDRFIGDRIKLAREEAGLTQVELSKKIGFKDRQTLGAIEVGERRIKVDELAALISIFNKPLEFFTDPFILPPPGRTIFLARHGAAIKAKRIRR